MPRRHFRKLMPAEGAVRDNRLLRVLGSTVLHKRFWQLNRHSTAWGVACGVFWAWIALPLQTVGAVLAAAAGRGNVPLAMAFTWLSNPVTWLPCFWLAYEVGLPLTPAEPIHVRGLVGDVMDGGPVGGTKLLLAELPRLYPMYVGGVVLGGITGAASYLAVSYFWRWHVARRWRRRHAARGLPERFTTGFAHLARLSSR